MKPKFELGLQRALQSLGQKDLLTVLVKTDDTAAVKSYLEKISSESNVTIKFRVKPLLQVIILSATKEVIEQLADRDDVSFVSSNKQVTALEN